MADFAKYRRKTIAELRPFEPEDGAAVMQGLISVGAAARAEGSPKQGDYVARDPSNPADQWLVTGEYFAEHYEPVEP